MFIITNPFDYIRLVSVLQPSSGRPPSCLYEPCEVGICCALIGRFPGGEKAPDKWAWLASANQRSPLVFVEAGG